MENCTRVLSLEQIRNLNIKQEDVLGFDFQWINDVEHHFLLINGVRRVSFCLRNDLRKCSAKIKKMGLGLGWQTPQLTDEEKGIIRAAEIGENPFYFQMICSNPEMNGSSEKYLESDE